MLLQKDVLILLLKAVHRYRLMKCHGEYDETYYYGMMNHEVYVMKFCANRCYAFNWRYLLCGFHLTDIYRGRHYVYVGQLPQRYIYSSGLNNPKGYL